MLPPKDSDLVNNTIKDPYIFDFITLKEEYKEKELEEALITKIRNVLLELGKDLALSEINTKFQLIIKIIILICYFITWNLDVMWLLN